jgi:prolyl-tRNA synthetase
MAGVYSYLPLGLKVMNNISNIVREEMNAIGGEELLLSSLQDKVLWESTNRWSDDVVDIWFKTELKAGGEVGLGLTHEEPLVRLMKNHINSYKDLPRSAYQIQTKFRNELRAKSGLLRGREFLMKDLYSFSRDEAEHQEFYEKSKTAYTNVYNRVGIGADTYITFASGGIFSKYSHEFQAVSEVGEDIIYISEEKGIAVNKEVLNDEVLAELSLNKGDLVEKKAIEVGNIFTLGTKFSEPLGLSFKDEEGKEMPVFMGCYGIGIGRLMATVVEKHNDEKGIKWPVSIAPYRVHLLVLSKESAGEVRSFAEEVYAHLEEDGFEVLFDDRDQSPGEKLADADLMGMPYRAVVSERTVGEKKIEIKRRWNDDEAELVDYDGLIKILKEFEK